MSDYSIDDEVDCSKDK